MHGIFSPRFSQTLMHWHLGFVLLLQVTCRMRPVCAGPSCLGLGWPNSDGGGGARWRSRRYNTVVGALSHRREVVADGGTTSSSGSGRPRVVSGRRGRRGEHCRRRRWRWGGAIGAGSRHQRRRRRWSNVEGRSVAEGGVETDHVASSRWGHTQPVAQ
jgi:hypothetical protein